MKPKPQIDITPKLGAWGVYDKQGECWIGQESGPFTYLDTEIDGVTVTGEVIARLGATVMDERMQTRFRFAARIYTENATVKRDVLKPVIDLATALKQIEAKAGPVTEQDKG